MTPDEENLTASAKLLSLIQESSKAIGTAVDKAKANGVVTRAEALDDKKSVNLTTILVGVATVGGAALVVAAGVWFLMTLMLAPMQKNQDRFEAVQVRQDEKIDAMLERFGIPQPPPKTEAPKP